MFCRDTSVPVLAKLTAALHRQLATNVQNTVIHILTIWCFILPRNIINPHLNHKLTVKYDCERNYFWKLWIWQHSVFSCLQLFYQLKGDMCLKVIQNGKHKDVHIKEGEVSYHSIILCCPAVSHVLHWLHSRKSGLLQVHRPHLLLFILCYWFHFFFTNTNNTGKYFPLSVSVALISLCYPEPRIVSGVSAPQCHTLKAWVEYKRPS